MVTEPAFLLCYLHKVKVQSTRPLQTRANLQGTGTTCDVAGFPVMPARGEDHPRDGE